MSDYVSVLAAAQELPEDERLRLIEALWEHLPESEAYPFSDDWKQEIERRLAEVDAGTAVMHSWEEVRSEALARIGHAKTN